MFSNLAELDLNVGLGPWTVSGTGLYLILGMTFKILNIQRLITHIRTVPGMWTCPAPLGAQKI